LLPSLLAHETITLPKGDQAEEANDEETSPTWTVEELEALLASANLAYEKEGMFAMTPPKCCFFLLKLLIILINCYLVIYNYKTNNQIIK